jgi:molecular chaperone DnaK
MVKDALAHAEEDKKKRELIDAKNKAESMIHQAEKTLNDFGDKVASADKTAIETAVEELKKASEGDNLDEINNKTDALMNASMKLGEAMYKEQQAAGGASAEQAGAAGAEQPGADAGKKDDGTIDADFEEVKK